MKTEKGMLKNSIYSARIDRGLVAYDRSTPRLDFSPGKPSRCLGPGATFNERWRRKSGLLGRQSQPLYFRMCVMQDGCHEATTDFGGRSDFDAAAHPGAVSYGNTFMETH